MKVKQRRVLLEGPTDSTGKLRIHETSRPLGTDTYFTSCSDDITNINKVGGTTDKLLIRHDIGEPDPESKYMDLNIAANETWLHEGYMSWKGFNGDLVTLEVVTLPTATTSGVNTNYNLYGGYLIIPAAGDGTIQLTNDMTDPRHGLVYMPDNDEGQPPKAYWNADYNPDTGLYENITPNYTGEGRYNMFNMEVVIGRFVNKICLLDNGFMMLQTADTARLGQGMRIKMTIDKDDDVADHAFSISAILTLHRSRSV